MAHELNVKQLTPDVYLMDEGGESTGYLVVGAEKACVIDTMNGYNDLKKAVRDITDKPLMVINTHGHPDHIHGNIYFEEAYINPKDLDLAKVFIEDPEYQKFLKEKNAVFPPFKPIQGGDVVDLGGRTLKIYDLPGHTPGGILLLLKEERILFVGDSINHHLWMQLEGCPEMEELVKTLDKVMFLEKEADHILHGHATGYDDISLLRCIKRGAEEICEGKTEDDLPYQWFGGVGLQHPFKLEEGKTYNQIHSVICYTPKEPVDVDIKNFYETRMYGTWRFGEQVSYELLGEDQGKDHGKNPFAPVGGELVKIIVKKDDKRAEFTVHAYLPKKEDRVKYKNGSPFIICMHPIAPSDYALSKGYALFFMESVKIASDDTKHLGAFYDIYPYGETAEEQTGVLMAWAWGASKVLDAVYAGLYKEFHLDPDASMVTGVSRWGKATAVCGAFDERFKMTIPACSGAGGLALYNYVSEGKTYDFTSIGGPKEYTYTKNEPLDCLQSEAERGWFNDRFLKFKIPEDIPFGQENLPIMAMDPQRFYFIIAACMGEDWVNAPAMWECYKKADAAYASAGLSDHLVTHFHKEGHAVLLEDMELIIDYFDHMYEGTDTGIPMEKLKTSVFDRQ